ncbi:GrpB family protein [Rivularia sp. UHCC 0363]|uniref:GrpB family protein n=1 Tax=Rivularia sp. UHCC 0363 TaxID=3110244 RepID=UPI002B21CC51|nr:GrpB family protein [Rivularia sp. UHCC 0363]MEA5598384.1 GrpB family protein [Rivularia sp. UHCC 0363]
MDQIEIVDYNPDWANMFEREAESIRKALRNLIAEIQHIGSTAVPGLAAKPIIDIMVGVRCLADGQSTIKPLEDLGYVYWSNNPNSEKMFFVKGMPPYGEKRTHHVHVVEVDGEFWQRRLFRDYLRIHPQEARRYETLKRDLAVRFRDDREAYTQGKTDYIREVMKKALAFSFYPKSPTP